MKPSPSSASQVVTLGECMAVLFPERAVGLDRAPSLRLDIAGTEANTAIGLARLGIRCRFISRVGDDPLGRRIRLTLDREGVDTRFLKTDDGAPTGVFFREPLSDGARRVFYYRAGSAASRLAPGDLPAEAFAGAMVVHLSGITPALSSTCAATVDRAIEIAHQNRALVSFDPNYRARLWDAATARATLTDVIRRIDVLLLSDEDASVLFPGASVSEILHQSTSLGPTAVVLKRAEQGASAVVLGERFTVPTRKVRRVVDTVGAGDGFNAGFLAGLVRGWETRDSLELGAEIGALAVQKLGDYAGYPRARGKRKSPSRKSPGKRKRA